MAHSNRILIITDPFINRRGFLLNNNEVKIRNDPLMDF